MSVESHGGLTSVDRALQILELLRHHRTVRVMEVAEHLGVARSTAHRLLQALVHRQFVVQDANKLYHRGPAFLTAGFGDDRIPVLRGVARLHLERLSVALQETCHLAVIEGNGARFIDGVESPQILRVGLRIGMLLPAHTTAAGKTLLAELSDAELFALYPRGLPGSPVEANRRASLRRELATVRKRRYATNIDESAKGVRAAAVVVKNSDGLAVASIAVAAPSARCPRSGLARLAEHLHEAARAIEGNLADTDFAVQGRRTPSAAG
ncbi:IclR family transcriptional regulator [Streptomyces phaeolivaceus]|uniref:IclR family transcriptional regulator n=1 Tax=Streptomyces phaeolivaceus TaxID=2653200 RepID=UPI001D04F4C3|nr:IclR family transcriptional regulator [Streptomyces phaeolivaceus]